MLHLGLFTTQSLFDQSLDSVLTFIHCTKEASLIGSDNFTNMDIRKSI